MSFFDYTQRSFEQIFDAIKAKVKANVPEITDYSDNNPFVFRLRVWSGMMEQLNYYLDRVAKNTYLATTDLFRYGVNLAYEADYRVKGKKAASADLTFSFNNPLPSDVTIPAGTQVNTVDGIQFYTDEEITILTGQQSGTVGATNKVSASNVTVGTSDGSENQTFILGEADILDGSLTVSVGLDMFVPVETLAYSTETDKHFVARLNKDNLFVLEFGDGVTGEVPANGQDIIVSYSITDGLSGNVSEGTINNLISLIPVPSGFILSVTNLLAASGGGDEDTLSVLKTKVPRQRRTLERAVTKQDYEDIALLYNGVEQAGARETDCKLVDVYIVPDGGGIASSTLTGNVRASMEDKRILGVELNVLPAGETDVVLNIDLEVLPNFNQSTVSANVVSALAAFGSPANQEIGGRMRLGNLYQAIESVEGVSVSNIVVFTTIPYAEPIGHETQLSWQREVQSESSQTVKWQFRMQAASVVELYKNDSFVGLIDVGTQYEYDEIIFTVLSGSYSVGDTWVFYTYPYNVNLDLQDFSILSIKSSNVTINATGGV